MKQREVLSLTAQAHAALINTVHTLSFQDSKGPFDKAAPPSQYYSQIAGALNEWC